jgi:hypothetical protein
MAPGSAAVLIGAVLVLAAVVAWYFWHQGLVPAPVPIPWHVVLPTFTVTGLAYNLPAPGPSMNVLMASVAQPVDPKLLGGSVSVTLTKVDPANPHAQEIQRAFSPYKGFIVGLTPGTGGTLVALYPPPPAFGGTWSFTMTGIAGILAVVPPWCACTCSVQSVPLAAYWWDDPGGIRGALAFQANASLPSSFVGKDAVVDVVAPGAGNLPLDASLLPSLSPYRGKIAALQARASGTTLVAVAPVPDAFKNTHPGSGLIAQGSLTVWTEDPACPCCHSAPT